MTVSERKPAETFHPGTFVREEMEARGWKIDELAVKLGWSKLALRRMINGDRVGRVAAPDLARVFGNSEEFWLNLQERFDEG